MLRSLTIFVSLTLALVLCASAQTRSQGGDKAGAATTKRDRRALHQEPAQETAGATASARLVDPPRADYLSGEANVAVSGNRNPIIRLGLSPNGATIIEFPASDRLFNIIPGNSNLVTIEESETKATDRFVIARPGDGFASPATMANARRAPATSVMVQMTSGLVLTFLFYPVPQLSEQAHRVVITYDRNEVVAARRAAGLAVNLDNTSEVEKPRTTSMRVPAQPGSSVPVSPQDAETPVRTQPSRGAIDVADVADIDTSQTPEKQAIGHKSWLLFGKGGDPARAASFALTEATKSPKSFKKWSRTVHGLSLSVSPVKEVSKRSQVVVVAVRNTKERDARIVPGQPGVYLETFDGKGRPLQIESIRKLAMETTVTDEVIPAGETRYYAVIYEAPIMGVRQRLKIGVGQTVAADEPATANLITNR
jgi:hypothetical protein